jgi:hypothetical protein
MILREVLVPRQSLEPGLFFLCFVEDFDDFLNRGLLQLFATPAQVLAEANGGVLHALVRFLGTADQNEMLASSQPPVSILIIQPQTDKSYDLTLFPIVFTWH